VSRIESGLSLPSLPQVAAWAEAVGASADTAQALTQLTEELFTETRSWRTALRNRAHLQDDIQQREANAHSIRTFQPSIVPGLLQTPEYARRIFSLFQVPYSDENLATAMAARLDRQLALFDEDKQFQFLITEAALRWCPGPASLMRAQLDRLASLDTLHNVSIGLIRDGGRVETAIPHGFIIYDGRGAHLDTFVTVELVHADLVLNDLDDIDLYQSRWSLLHKMAIFDDDAHEFIASLIPSEP